MNLKRRENNGTVPRQRALETQVGYSQDSSSPIRDFVRRHLFVIVVLCITIAALGLRMSAYYFRSGDFNGFLSVWYRDLQAGGLGIRPKSCNYSPAYVTILYLLGQITDNSLASIKAVSICFDFAMAASGAWLVSRLLEATHPHRRLLCTLTYTVLLLLPEVVLNSGVWAQCDAIYTTFCILAIAFLIRRQMVPAFLLMGLALAFKLQAIFVLPLFILVWLSDKKCHLLHFLLIPGAMLVTGIPTAIAGRPIWEVFTVYVTQQAGKVRLMNANCPNLYSFLTPNEIDAASHADYAIFGPFAVILTLILMGLAAALVLRAGRRLDGEEQVLLGALCSFLCVFFLPNMHERYIYPTDLLLCLLALYTRKRGDILCAALCMAVSTISQTNFLFHIQTAPNWALALVRLGCLLYLTVRVLRRLAPEVLKR